MTQTSGIERKGDQNHGFTCTQSFAYIRIVPSRARQRNACICLPQSSEGSGCFEPAAILWQGTQRALARRLSHHVCPGAHLRSVCNQAVGGIASRCHSDVPDTRRHCCHDLPVYGSVLCRASSVGQRSAGFYRRGPVPGVQNLRISKSGSVRISGESLDYGNYFSATLCPKRNVGPTARRTLLRPCLSRSSKRFT